MPSLGTNPLWAQRREGRVNRRLTFHPVCVWQFTLSHFVQLLCLYTHIRFNYRHEMQSRGNEFLKV